MVVVKSVKVTPLPDGTIESTAVVTVANGDKVTSGDVGLAYISAIKAVIPTTAGHVLGGAEITNPGSVNNEVTLTLYSLTANADSLVAAGSADWIIVAAQI